MIRLNQLSFTYGSNSEPVLSDINLEIRPGESVVIMGPNGSGKSTLARIIAGLVKPTTGKVTLDSENNLSQVGFLFQNPDNQMVAMMVAKEIAFALENKAVPVDEMHFLVDAMLAKMGIADLKDRLTSELSGGEKQRVALASSIICHPQILILDEPDSFLDADGRRRLTENLDDLKSDNPDLIIIRITQYERVAKESLRLILLDKQTIIADGSPVQIIDKYYQNENNFSEIPDLELLKENKLPTSSRPVKIEFENVQIGYSGSTPVLNNFSSTLTVGETVGLFGPTGSGKSTLGQAICGLIPLSSGSMMLHMEDGRVTEQLPPGSIAGVMQMPERQFFLPTCAEEIAFGPKNHSKPFSDIQIGQFFNLVGLKPEIFAERDPLSLSVGEKRRLAFAAVLSIRPSFVIFDEPTAALDTEGVKRFILLSKYLRQLGFGQVIISHEKEIIQSLTDRAWCLPGDGSFVEIPDSRQIEDQDLIKFMAE